MRSRASCRSTGIFLTLSCLLVQVLSDESASSEEYEFDNFDGRKYQNSADEPVIRLFNDHTISKNVNINSNILFSPGGNTDEELPSQEPNVEVENSTTTVEDELTMKLYAAVIFRDNMLRVFGHVLYVSKSEISVSQYSSLYIIHKALRCNLVYVYDMLPIMDVIQEQRKTLQWKTILAELAKNLPPYLKSTAEFLIYEINDKRLNPEALFPYGVEGLPDFLDHLEPELINLCETVSSTEDNREHDELSEMNLGPVFIEVLKKIINRQINFTQRLFAVILMSLPQNGEDPILDENIRYIFELSKLALIPFWDIASFNHDAADPYELIYSAISKILIGARIPIFVRESLFYIKNHLNPITVTHIDPMNKPIKEIVSNGFNVNLILSSIVEFDFSSDVVHLRDRLLYFIQRGYVDMEIILDGMNIFIYNNPMDLLIALLTRMHKRIQPSYIEIHRTITALLSSLVLKKEMCTFRPNISPSIGIITILGYLQNPALNPALWKEADSLYVYILNHPDEFKDLNTLIPSEKENCVLPRQCIINILTDIEYIENQMTYEKLKTLQLIIIKSYSNWKDLCLNDSLVGNNTDNVIPETTNPENDQTKNPLIIVCGGVGLPVPVYDTWSKKKCPFEPPKGSSSATTNNPAASTTAADTTAAAATTVAITAAATVTTTSTTEQPAQTITDQILTEATEDSTEPAKPIAESEVKSTELAIPEAMPSNYPWITPDLPETDGKCCLLPQGVKPNAEIHVGLNIHGIPSTVSGDNQTVRSNMETLELPSILILMSPPNVKAPLVEFGVYFQATILNPLQSIYGLGYLIKIFETSLQIQYYPTNIALLLALLEKALKLPEVTINVALCLIIEKYIQVINYLSIVILMPMLSQYNHIKGNIIYSIINDKDPRQNFIVEKSPTSLSQGTVCFPLLHPKYYLLAIDQKNPYAGLLPEPSSVFQYIEYILILKPFLVTETIHKLIGSDFNPLAYPNRGTLLCAILQALSKLSIVQHDVKLNFIVTGYLKAIRSWILYTNIPSSFISSFPAYGSNEVPSANWKPYLPNLMVLLPPATTLLEIGAKKQLKLVLSKENLLTIIGVPKPTTDTKRSVLLIQIIQALLTAKNVWISPILMPVLKTYIQILKTKFVFDTTIKWVWVNAFTEKEDLKFDQVIPNCLAYNDLPYKAKVAYNFVMKYFTKHSQFLSNLIPHIGLLTKATQGLYLRGLFMHLLHSNNMRPSVKRYLGILIPHIKLQGSLSLLSSKLTQRNRN